MNTHNHVQQMMQYLNNEIQQAQLLDKALDEEKDALNKGDATEIEQHSQHKIQALKSLETFEQQRIQLLTTLGLDNRMDQYIEQYDSSKTISDSWSRLMGIMQQCHDKNQGNGIIIELNRQRIQRSLDILHGNEGDKDNTYSTTGKTTSKTTCQTIARV